MYIKKLIRDEKEYWEFVYPFVFWSDNNTHSLWREEDLPKLRPFFDAQSQSRGKGIAWSEEIQKSFDFYKECHENYGKHNAEIRDATSQIGCYDILEAFGYDSLPDIEYDDESTSAPEYSEAVNPSLLEDFDSTFPFIVIGDINSGFDRMGKTSSCFIYRVSLDEFRLPGWTSESQVDALTTNRGD